jgi:hypothetical protein
VKFQADATDLTISERGGPVKQPVQYGRESAHKSRAVGAHSSPGKTTCSRFNINKEENVLISGTREKSAVADSAEPKQ